VPKPFLEYVKAAVVGAGYLLLLLSLKVTQAAPNEEHVEDKTSIHVEITTHLGDKQTFVEGDTISFFLSLDKDAYIVAIYEDADDKRIQILPNTKQEDNFFPAGLFIPLPGEGSSFRFTVSAPFGRETVWVFASKEPIPEFQGEVLGNGLKRLHGDMASIRNQIEAVAQSSFGEHRLSIFTKARN
jgi:hypothetical protein